jgi:hypothetical protein
MVLINVLLRRCAVCQIIKRFGSVGARFVQYLNIRLISDKVFVTNFTITGHKLKPQLHLQNLRPFRSS